MAPSKKAAGRGAKARASSLADVKPEPTDAANLAVAELKARGHELTIRGYFTDARV